MQPNYDSLISDAQRQNAQYATDPSTIGSIGSTLHQAQQALGDGQGTPQAAPAGPQENWMERLLPTAGGILGAVVASPLDPITGGLASVGAAGLGSALGRAGENALTGQKVLQGNVAASGVEGLAGQGIGKAAGAVLGKGAEMLGNRAASLTEQQTAKAEQATRQIENDRVGKEFAAVKPEQASVGDALIRAKALGITNPTAKDLVNISNVYTGSNPETGDGVLNFYKQQALNDAGGTIDLNSAMSDLHDTLNAPENQLLGGVSPVSSARGQLPQVPNTTASKIVQQFRNMLPAPVTDENGQISQVLTPEQGTTLLKGIGKQLTISQPKQTPMGILPEAKAENDVWHGLYDNVRSAVYNRPEVDTAVQARTVGPDEESVIDDAIKKNGITDPGVAANIKADLIKTINNGQNADSWLKAESPMVNMSKAGNIAVKDFENNPQLPRNVRNAQQKAEEQAPNKLLSTDNAINAGGLLEATIGHNPGMGMAIPMMYQAGKAAANSPMALNAAGGALSKVAGGILPTVAGETVANSPNDVAGPADATNGIQMNGGQMDPNNSQLDDYLRLAMSNAALGNSGGLDQLLPMAQKEHAAMSVLPQLQQDFNQAGGAQGPIGGILDRLGATLTGGEAASYPAQAQADAQIIAQATGQDPRAVMAELPKITQNQTAAQASLNNIQSLIQALSLGNNTGPGIVQAVSR